MKITIDVPKSKEGKVVSAICESWGYKQGVGKGKDKTKDMKMFTQEALNRYITGLVTRYEVEQKQRELSKRKSLVTTKIR